MKVRSRIHSKRWCFSFPIPKVSTGSFGKALLPPGFMLRRPLASLNLVPFIAGIWEKVKRNYILTDESIIKDRTGVLSE